jgi:hypothetical protein
MRRRRGGEEEERRRRRRMRRTKSLNSNSTRQQDIRDRKARIYELYVRILSKPTTRRQGNSERRGSERGGGKA